MKFGFCFVSQKKSHKSHGMEGNNMKGPKVIITKIILHKNTSKNKWPLHVKVTKFYESICIEYQDTFFQSIFIEC